MEYIIKVTNFDALYEVENISQLTAIFKKEDGEIRHYECKKEERGYIFRCLEDGQGLNSWHRTTRELVQNAITPVGVPMLDITVIFNNDLPF